MSRRCDACGKKPSSGCNVSHSNRRTKRKFLPNLFKKKLFDEVTKKFAIKKLCTRCIRTLSKNADKYGISVQALVRIKRK